MVDHEIDLHHIHIFASDIDTTLDWWLAPCFGTTDLRFLQ